jgi:hypothetical protein
MVELHPEAPPSQPAFAFRFEPGEGWRLTARGLPPDLVGRRLESLLRVRVAEAGDDGDVPTVLGDHEITDDGVDFVPRYPLEPGVLFRATLDLRVLGRPGLGEVHTLLFSVPKETEAGDTEVTQVFPSSSVLPENALRFTVRFSRPMRRGGAETNIAVLGPHGWPAPDILYRAPVELWDRSMTCLTVLLDPGRLKRGVGPNRTLGPPLRSGQLHALAISPGMIDGNGRPLRQGFRKSFLVSDAVREPIAFERWTIRAPASGTLDPLELEFPKPLDWAQLWRGIAVASESGAPVGGRIDINRGETLWRLTPDAPWRTGRYRVHVSPALEDVCGNTIDGPFDGPVRSGGDMALERIIRSRPFVVTEARRRARGRVVDSRLSIVRPPLTPADRGRASAPSARRIP